VSRLDDVMDTEDESSSEPSGQATGGDRMSSIMEDDYETVDDSAGEPEDNQIKDDPIPSSDKPKEEKEKKEKKEKKEGEEEEEEEEKEEKKEEPKPTDKKKIKFKVDGQEVEEEVSEQDLINNYSGQKAIQKRFLEIDRSKKELAQERDGFTKEFDYVKQEMQDVRASFSTVLEDFQKTGRISGNPLDGVFNLLDNMGLDTKEYDKLLFSHYIPEVARFLEMDENGREAFVLKKENDWLRKGSDKIESQKKQNAEERRKLEEENSLKRQNGVSEESFNELKNELAERFNLQNLNTEQVIQWSKEKPAYTRAESIVEKVPGVDVVKIAKILLEFPDTTDEWMLEQLGYKQILEKRASEELKNKIPPKPSQKKSMDDDEDDELFKQFRRR
jgi:hypothetical protein